MPWVLPSASSVRRSWSWMRVRASCQGSVLCARLGKGQAHSARILRRVCAVTKDLDAFLSALRSNPSMHKLPHPPKSYGECQLLSPQMGNLLVSLLDGPLEAGKCSNLARLYSSPTPTRRATPQQQVSLDYCMRVPAVELLNKHSSYRLITIRAPLADPGRSVRELAARVQGRH
jgi:hypothetical protein